MHRHQPTTVVCAPIRSHHFLWVEAKCHLQGSAVCTTQEIGKDMWSEGMEEKMVWTCEEIQGYKHLVRDYEIDQKRPRRYV